MGAHISRGTKKWAKTANNAPASVLCGTAVWRLVLL